MRPPPVTMTAAKVIQLPCTHCSPKQVDYVCDVVPITGKLSG